MTGQNASTEAEAQSGEPDIASVASAFADPRRARVLMALADGRALPAGRLAEEAGVSASTVSNHLAVLLGRGLVTVQQQGRHRYYRLAGDEVEGVLEALAALAPRTPITSLRQHTRAHAVRTARTCYRHLAGQAGVDFFQRILVAEWVVGGDGRHHPETGDDELSSAGKGRQYRLTAVGAEALRRWGVAPAVLSTERPLRYCVDWTEQAHHLAGPLGTAITDRLFELGWIVRGTVPRSVTVTPSGVRGIAALVEGGGPVDE
ncbi:ArsR/SmtB family transcription factor [Gordonia phthalatica]|uniref:ArsR family transcriptional regulator n=1 Tax=Gordonia phthalatica TaxID=1136941 RepID=A0A0N7FUF3_9ACTN|nr:metalloregulator ArsR/SmtB family transcription factor [Gordonia phthalatica]ALG84199.1 ArsR family transcriptional regulator [Gordonia phthalatica]